MKMVLVVCPEARHEQFRNSVEEHGVHAYTEIRHAIGEGVTGKKFGNRTWPDESVIIFMVIEDEKKADVARVVKECQSKLYPAEGMRAFVMPVEEVL
jgi:nitrogen regulatory protein PII